MKHISLFVATCAFVAFVLPPSVSFAANETVRAHVPPNAADDERAGEDLSAELEAIRAESGLPGMVAMVLQEGEVVAWGAAGVRAAGADGKVSIDDPFHLGSCTKAVTSTLVAVLVEDGLLAWDTKILDVFPELKDDADPGYAEATIDHLLHHRAGIAERTRDVEAVHERILGLPGTPAEQRVEVVRIALSLPPHTAPGVQMDYSNIGYMVAAAMIERLSGKTWEALMVERIFEPLEMTSAGIGSPAGDGVPVGHNRDGDRWAPLPAGPGGTLPDNMGPAGLMHSNLRDWSKFVCAHMAGARGEDGIVKARTFQHLQDDDPPHTYGCGWLLGSRAWSWGEGATLAHNGSDGTWYSLVLAMPEWDVVALVAVNCGGASADPAARRVEAMLMEAAGF